MKDDPFDKALILRVCRLIINLPITLSQAWWSFQVVWYSYYYHSSTMRHPNTGSPNRCLFSKLVKAVYSVNSIQWILPTERILSIGRYYRLDTTHWIPSAGYNRLVNKVCSINQSVVDLLSLLSLSEYDPQSGHGLCGRQQVRLGV